MKNEGGFFRHATVEELIEELEEKESWPTELYYKYRRGRMILKTTLRRFRNFFRNAIRYREFLKLDEDWDFSYTYTFLLQKLTNMENIFPDNACIANADKVARDIRVAKALVRRIERDDYWERANENWERASYSYTNDRKYLYSLILRKGDRWWE